jgi:hypothetical protein
MIRLMANKRRCTGQSVIEYCVTIIVIIGALISMQVYFKRGLQGRWKAAVEEMTQEYYDPRFTDSDITYRTEANSVVRIWTAYEGDTMWTMRQDDTTSVESREGSTVIGGY